MTGLGDIGQSWYRMLIWMCSSWYGLTSHNPFLHCRCIFLLQRFLFLRQTQVSLGAWWASADGEGVWNVTGRTNAMQASECDQHCNWNDQDVGHIAGS